MAHGQNVNPELAQKLAEACTVKMTELEQEILSLKRLVSELQSGLAQTGNHFEKRLLAVEKYLPSIEKAYAGEIAPEGNVERFLVDALANGNARENEDARPAV